MFMHPQVDCSPEQLGKAQEQWARLLETRLSNMPNTAAVQNTHTSEFIPLDNNNSQAPEEYQQDYSRRRKENKASTQGLGNRHKYKNSPWRPKNHHYSKGING